MGRPKKEQTEPIKILSWRVDEPLAKMFNDVHTASPKDRSKVDTLRRLIEKEAKRLKLKP